MPVKYVPFVPEPIEGQAVLQNFNRILKYKGVDEISMLLERGMPLYEVEKVETVGKENSGNIVMRGECVSACAYLKENDIKVDLVYIDPPFASGADYAKKVYVRRNPKVAKAIEQAEKDLADDEFRTFEEKMYGDVWDKEKYLNWMYENLVAIKSVMSETASVYVHLDWHIAHYVKILMDEIFGENNFINELIWCYRGMAVSNDHYTRRHDTILFYSVSDKHVFNWRDIAEKFTDSTLKKYKHIDKDGRRFRLHGRNITGSPIKNMTDIDTEWLDTNPELCRIDYLDQKDGVRARDWFQFDYINVWSTERVDYATQKPEELLIKIIKASSNKNTIVADFFGGSGVTAKVANDLERNFIHCDVGENSIQTTRDRLVSSEANFDILDIKDGVQLYRNPVQTMDKISKLIPSLKNDDSLESFWEGYITDSRFGKMPVYVPNLIDSSSKLLNEYSIERIIHEAIPDLEANIKKVIVYYIDIEDKDEIYKVIKNDKNCRVEIELRDLKDILDDVVVDDFAEFDVREEMTTVLDKYTIEIKNFCSDRVSSKIEQFNAKGVLNDKKGNFKPILISNEGLELIELLSVDCTSDNGIWHSDSELKIDTKGLVIRNGKKTNDFWDGKIYCEQTPKRLKIRNICGDATIWKIDEKSWK